MTKIWTWDGDSESDFYSLIVYDGKPFHIHNQYDFEQDSWFVSSDKKLPTPVLVENAYNCYQYVCSDTTKFHYHKDEDLEVIVIDICDHQETMLEPSIGPMNMDDKRYDWDVLHTLNQYRHATPEQKDAMFHYWAGPGYKWVEEREKLKGGLDE